MNSSTDFLTNKFTPFIFIIAVSISLSLVLLLPKEEWKDKIDNVNLIYERKTPKPRLDKCGNVIGFDNPKINKISFTTEKEHLFETRTYVVRDGYLYESSFEVIHKKDKR